VLVIAIRKVAAWGLTGIERDDVILYGKGLARGASLGRSPGGRAILEKFGIDFPSNKQLHKYLMLSDDRIETAEHLDSPSPERERRLAHQ